MFGLMALRKFSGSSGSTKVTSIAKAPEADVELRVGAAVERAGGDHVIAGLHQAGDGDELRRLPAGHGQRGHAVLERGHALRSFPPSPPKSSSLTLSVRVMVAWRVCGLASVPISNSPCTMIHSVVSSRSLLSAKLSLPLIVKPCNSGGVTSRTTFMSLPMVTRASLPGTFLSGQVAGSDQRFPLVEACC